MVQLIYVADPMCSWCYGFSREISRLIASEGAVQLQLVAGGLSPFNTKVMDDNQKLAVKAHWKEVEKETGLTFSNQTMSQKDFVYDTEPACRAVVAIRETVPEMSLGYMHVLQKAFYVEGQNITQPTVLAEVAEKIGLDRKNFEAAFELQSIKDATADDFAMTKRWNISGFPTLLLKQGRKLHVLTIGYAKCDELMARLDEVKAALV